MFLKELEGKIESQNNDQQSATIENSESLALTVEVRVLLIIRSTVIHLSWKFLMVVHIMVLVHSSGKVLVIRLMHFSLKGLCLDEVF